MSEYRVRDAVISDLASICQIHNHYIEQSTVSFDSRCHSLADKESWLQEHQQSGLPVLVLEDQVANLIGFAALSFFQGGCSFRQTVEPTIYLAEGFTGKGLGKHLMKSLMTAAQSRGYRAIVALVCAENDASIALAKSCGFNQCGLLKEVAFKFDRWLDLIILQKVL